MAILNKNLGKACILAASSLFLVACGSSSSSSSSSALNSDAGTYTANLSIPTDASERADMLADLCAQDTGNQINWDALMHARCDDLSDYNLFQDPSDPTSGPNNGGVPYDLSVALFTDYASKYRYAFLPQGEQATYSESEVLEFPLGTVLVKTFAMPENTSIRDGNELVIETRLLINRENGWLALPYYWDPADNGEDASLALLGKTISGMTTNHDGVDLTFDYGVPKQQSCTSCHAKLSDESSTFIPIGPKSRYLNKDYTYEDGTTANQLSYWAEGGLLEGLPADMTTVEATELFDESVDVAGLDMAQLEDSARAYLDINCAHCHRSGLTLGEGMSGPAGSSGLQVEYNRVYDDAPAKFGTCKTAVAGGHGDYPYDVIPQNADDSYLLFRMSTNDPRHRMPELGRATVHQEGAALIERWINNLPAASCSP